MNGTPSKPLPFASWAAKPGLGEPGHGYFVRLVQEQEHVSGRVYAEDLEVNGISMRPAELLGQVLMLSLAEVHKQSLIRWTPAFEPGWFDISGARFRQLQVSYKRRRFCRACLAEAPYHRSWWDITSFSVCPFHSMEIEGNTSAGNVIRWWWPSFDMSADGDRLAVPAPRTEEQDSYEVYTLQRMGVDFGSRRARPLLDPYKFGEVVDMCGAIGQFLGNPRCETAPARRLTDYRLGYSALSQDEDHLQECFKDWLEREVPLSIRRRGMHNSVGWVVQGADRNYLLADLWPVARVILQRAFARVGHIGRQKTHDKLLPHGSLTMKELRERTGISLSGLGRIIKYLRTDDEQGLPITNDTVDQVKSFASRAVRLSEAARRLGCSQLCLRALAEKGHIRLFERTSLFRQDGRGACVLREDVDGLLAKAASVTPRDTIAVKITLAHFARKNQTSNASVIDRALNGALPPAAPINPARGFRSWMFDDPSRVVRNLGDSLLFTEAIATLGLDGVDFSAMVAHGVIQTVAMPGGVAVDRASLRKFDAHFVNARLYKKDLGCSNQGYEAALAALGVKRHFVDVPALTTLHIVERKELEEALGISTEVDSVTAQLWQTFRKEMVSRRTRFVLPETIGPKGIKAITCTRQTFVMISVAATGLVIRKCFTSKNSREWKVFVANSTQIRSGMACFHWRDEPNGECSAIFQMETGMDVVTAADALFNLERYYVHKK